MLFKNLSLFLIPRKFIIKSSLTICCRYSTIKEQKLLIKNQTINYIKTGHGNKTILCLPGALGTIWSDFKPQINDFDKNKFTLIAWDPPGYGQSRPPSRKFTSNFYENDAVMAYELMKELGFVKFSLLGWSDGGISSLILSGKYPDSIENLVIWGANCYLLPQDIESYEKIRDVNKWSDRMKTPLIQLYTEKGLQDLWNGWCDAMNSIYKKYGGDLCKDSLNKIKCPTLILHGDKDPMVTNEHPEYLVRNIKGAKLHRFPNGKHNIHLKYAEEFNQIVANFILGNN